MTFAFHIIKKIVIYHFNRHIDDGFVVYVSSPYDDYHVTIHRVLDHWVGEEYEMHLREFCQYLNAKINFHSRQISLIKTIHTRSYRK